MNDNTCIYCGSEPCAEPERCAQLEAELDQSLRDEQRRELRDAVWATVRQWCCIEGNRRLNLLERVFYTLKCLVCVLLRRNSPPSEPRYPPSIEVAQHHYAKLYAGWESKQIIVGYGVFRGWWYMLESDGDWWM